jgi:hypothetical protein
VSAKSDRFGSCQSFEAVVAFTHGAQRRGYGWVMNNCRSHCRSLPVGSRITTLVCAALWVCLTIPVAHADDACETLPSGLFPGIQLRRISPATFEPTLDPHLYLMRFQVLNEGDAEWVFDGTATFVRLQDTLRGYYFRAPASALFDEQGTTPVAGVAPAAYATIEIPVDGAAFQRCSSVELQIDPDGELGNGSCTDIYQDTKVSPTPCLTWNTRLTASALGTLDVYNLVPASAAWLKNGLPNMTIEEFVSSWYPVRTDGYLCSQCHYADAANPYAPPVAQGSITFQKLQPDVSYGGRRWNDISDGQGMAFQILGDADRIARGKPAKPRHLKLIFERWIRDGMRSSLDQLVPPLRE